MIRFSLNTNITDDPTISKIVDHAISLVQDYLTHFALSENFLEEIELAFGNCFDPAKLEELRQQWISGDFEALLNIEIRPVAEINGANGAFSAAINTIFLSQEFIEQNPFNSQAIADVLLEEFGHFVDAQINLLDAPRDEGEIFSALIQGKQLDELEIQRSKSEDDRASIALDGQVIQIEQAANNVSGVIKWTDSSGNQQPVRKSTVLIKRDLVSQDEDSDPVIARGETDEQGRYEIPLDQTINLGYVEVLADGPAHFVEKGEFLDSTYTQRSKTIESLKGGKEIPIIIGNKTDAERAFSISDAVYVGEVYAEDVRGQSPSKLEVNFPKSNTSFHPTIGDLNLEKVNAWDWDVILHEYGHYLAISDNLHPSSLPLFPLGNEHTVGSSNIPDFGKDKGTQLGWVEGLATYLGIAAQHIAARKKLLPDLPNIGDPDAVNPDTFYTDSTPDPTIPPDTPNNFLDWDLEKKEGRKGKDGLTGSGEGDEAPVARILWDLADGTRESHDRISIGHPNLYSVLKTIPNLDRLDDVWDYFFQNPDELRLPDLPEYQFDDAKIARLGAIFEEYSVSPNLSRIDFSNGDPGIKPDQNRGLTTFQPNDIIKLPTFKWLKGNNRANDSFQVLIFNKNFSEVKLSPEKLIENTGKSLIEWKPSLDEWSRITSTPGEYNIVITGSDNVENRKGDGPPATGPYWSGTYTFQVGDVAPKKVQFGALLDNGLDKLNVFQSKTNQILTKLPLLGNALSPSSGASQAFQTSQLAHEISTAAETSGLNFLGNLSKEIKNKFTQKFGDATEARVDQIQDAFFELLGPNGTFGTKGILKDSDEPGDAITKDDIEIIIDGSIVQFNIKLGGQEKLANISLPSNIGLPWLGFEFNDPDNPSSSTPKAGIDLDYTFDLGFGINTTTNDFFFETSPNEDLSISLTPSFPDATAKLGFLQVNAENKGSKLDFSVDLDDGEDGNDQLTLDELNQGNWRFTPNGSANVNLHLDTSFDGSTKLPQIGTDLVLNWDDLSKGTPDKFKFDNITLNLGSFFTGFASPIFDKIQTVTEPVQPIIKILTTPIDLKVAKADLLGVAQKLGVLDSSDENFIKNLQQLNNLAKSLKEGGNIPLNLGSVDLTGKGDITQPDFSSKVTLDKQPIDVVAELEKLKSTAKTELEKAEAEKAKTVVSGFKSVPGAGLEFPILTDPTTAVNLLLGKDVNLFTYALPQLGFNFEYEQFFPVIGPLGVRLGGEVGANVDLDFGYDAFGLKQFIQSQDVDDIFNGFFVSDRKPPTESGEDLKEATLNARITASASLEGGIIRGDAGGKIDGKIELDLNDPSNPDDGKVRVNEINELLDCPFDVSGKLSAGLFARLKVGFGPFSYTKHFNFVNKTLLSFEAGCDAAVSHKPNKDNFGLAKEDPIGSGILRINMGPHASARKTSGQAGKDEDEVFAVQAGTEVGVVDVSAFSITEPYKKIVRIIADGGQQDDTIQIGEGVSIPTSLKGGSGNDQLFGGSGKDTLEGEADDDALFGGKGDDNLSGGDGDDYLEGGAGADTLDGGSNNDRKEGGGDTVSYKDSPVGVRFSVNPSDSSFFTGSGGDAQGDRLKNIEHIEGSNFDDRLLGDNSSNTLEGLRGNDTLEGGGWDDILLGGVGADRLDGGSGRDWTGYIASSAEVKINLETGEASSGDAEGDTLISIEDVKGSIHNDILIGSRSNNHLDGYFGDDRIIGGGGADTIEGGDGIDWAIYNSSPDAVNVSLREGMGKGFGPFNLNGGDGKGDTFTSIENLEGSIHNDILEGDSKQNILTGLTGDDTLHGDGGNDTLIGGAGADALDGSGGIDWADYSDSPDFVVVDLTGTGTNADAQGDTFKRPPNGISTVENLLGTDYGDTLSGDNGDNEINPGLSSAGIDTVDGRNDKDNDLLTLDYSFKDEGTGMTGGFDQGSTSSGSFLRKRNEGHSIQDDAVSFSNIERLKIIGTIQNDEIFGGARDDILLPGAGNDTIYGGLSSNTINADDGNDEVVDQNDANGELNGTPDANSVINLDGGRGIDTLSVDLSAKSTDIFLESTNPQQESSNQRFQLPEQLGPNEKPKILITNFEVFKDINTGSGKDKLTQLGKVNNNFSTGAGDDMVNPGLGFDVVDGGSDYPNYPGIANDLLTLDYSVEDTGSRLFADIPTFNASDDGRYYRYASDGQTLLDQISFSNFEQFNITGTSKGDLLIGGNKSDVLSGGAGNDTLDGGWSGYSFASGTVDSLSGAAGADVFRLGDENAVYYSDTGDYDYAQITDFNSNQGDIIQLHGSSDDYSVEFITPTSTAVYLGQQDSDQQRELIAIIEGINLDLAADYIHYVNSDTVASNLAQNADSSAIAFSQTKSVMPIIAPSQSSSKTITTLHQLEEPTSALIPSQSGNTSTTFLEQAEASDLAFDLTRNNNSEQLLGNLLGDTTGLSNFKIELIGDGRAFGTYKNDPFDLGSGVALSTGRVTDLAGSNSEDGGFTPSGNQDLSQDFAEAGAAGDSISLKIEFDADATKEFLFFQYVFGSEEFAEFGGSPFNDNFSLTLNGFNFARLTDDSTVSINNLVPSPLGPYHPDFIYNLAQPGPVSNKTKLDGYTKPLLFQAPLVQNGRNTLDINVQDVNDGIFDSAVFIKGGTVSTKLPTAEHLDGKGGQKSFSVNAGDDAININNFGGVGRGKNPSPATIAEVDTIKLTDAPLTARNMILTQNGNDLEITFEGVANTKVVLTNLALENLDNLRKETRASVNLGNILFPGQTEIQDSYDVFNAEWQNSRIFKRNAVTFLNELNNTVKGFGRSNDVINGQGGNDRLNGLSGNDLLRGGAGNDTLLGSNGDDTLVGSAGNDQITSGKGRDRFILELNAGVDTITDFQDKHDRMSLSGITFTQLTITHGTGTNRNNTLISFNNSDSTDLLAVLTGVKSNIITSADFVTV